MKNKHIVICSGGELGDWAIPYVKQADICIGADRGALFLVLAGIKPYLSIGDFDSVTTDELEMIRMNSQYIKDFDAIDKDYTDTELALHEALALNPSQITIVGGLGTRFDHSIANIQLMTLTLNKSVSTTIIDAHNKMFLVSDQVEVVKEHYPYLSILPFSEVVDGITLTGMKYPLHNATLKKGQALGISNVILEQTATISITSGILLVIQSHD